MRFRFLGLAVLIGMVGVNLASADIIFTGGGADGNLAFADDNYDFSGSSVSAIDESTEIADNVLMTGTTLIATDFVGFGQYLIGDGFALTLNGATFTSNASGGVAGVAAGAASEFNLTNNSTMDIQFASVGATINVDGTSIVNFRGGGDGINSQTDTTNVILSQGGRLALPTVAEFTEQGGEIFAANSSGLIVSFTADTSILSFSGTTATAVFAAVPEPGALSLLAFGALATCMRRRK